MSQEEAIEEIKASAEMQFDTDIIKMFVEKVLGLEWEWKIEKQTLEVSDEIRRNDSGTTRCSAE